jgi:hypothetical protein
MSSVHGRRGQNSETIRENIRQTPLVVCGVELKDKLFDDQVSCDSSDHVPQPCSKLFAFSSSDGSSSASTAAYAT